jgi:hypothetical protein
MMHSNRFGLQAIKYLYSTGRTENQNITCYNHKKKWKNTKGKGSPQVGAGKGIYCSKKKKKIMIKRECTTVK